MFKRILVTITTIGLILSCCLGQNQMDRGLDHGLGNSLEKKYLKKDSGNGKGDPLNNTSTKGGIKIYQFVTDSQLAEYDLIVNKKREIKKKKNNLTEPTPIANNEKFSIQIVVDSKSKRLNFFTLHTMNQLQFSISDALGRMITPILLDRDTIDVSAFDSGIYTIRFQFQDRSWEHRFIIH